ncbi:hypothetical protein V502_01019 [Pseudogymnoascus sp. VKM F-4520 (FW-2644)]|nr:hypothetical protein V502_01019 [Pseudogymnoascus sp. VKM F-4520 (FW-2644)]
MSQPTTEEAQPTLLWKSNALSKVKDLKSATTNSQFTNLLEAFDAVDQRRGKNVILLTRTSVGWTIFEYVGSSACKVNFKKFRINGLPLGGDPISPQTYIIAGKDRVSRILHDENGYRLQESPRHAEEPASPWIVEAFVPEEETNHGKNLTWLPHFTLRPSPDELPAAIKWVSANLSIRNTVRAGGSKHSWSPVGTTSGVYVEPYRMKLSLTIANEQPVYRADIPIDVINNLVRAGSGNTIKEMNRWLWEIGLAFPYLGGYDGQTLGGVFPTGTHGSVFTRGPLAEMIMSTDLILASGETVRIEPKDGITDREALKRELPHIRLIQDDSYYYAALINIGTMGVVHSYILKVTPRFHMNEIRTASTITEIKNKLREEGIYRLSGTPLDLKPVDMESIPPTISNGISDGGFKDQPLKPYHLELLINPHSEKVVITSRHPTLVAISTDNEMEFTPPGRDLIKTIHLTPRLTRPAFPTWLQERFNGLLSWGFDTILKLFPCMIPGLLDSAMDTLVDDAYTDRSFNVFNVGDGTNAIPALAGTMYVPVSQDQYLVALDTIHETARQYATAHRRYQTGMVSLRFVKGSVAHLSPNEDYCSFEFIFTGATTYAQNMLNEYEAALRQRLGENRVWIHWGQLVDSTNGKGRRAQYTGFKRWAEVKKDLDPEGRFSGWETSAL